MSHQQGRVIHDADSHIIEGRGWLESYATEYVKTNLDTGAFDLNMKALDPLMAAADKRLAGDDPALAAAQPGAAGAAPHGAKLKPGLGHPAEQPACAVRPRRRTEGRPRTLALARARLQLDGCAWAGSPRRGPLV